MAISKFLYPRTIAITRLMSELSTGGGQGGGLPSQTGGTGTYWAPSSQVATSGAGEAAIMQNIPCSIQSSPGRVTAIGEVPSDASGPIRWRIYIPLSAAAPGSIIERDIATDDFGNRYQIDAAYPASLGYRLETRRLEA